MYVNDRPVLDASASTSTTTASSPPVDGGLVSPWLPHGATQRPEQDRTNDTRSGAPSVRPTKPGLAALAWRKQFTHVFRSASGPLGSESAQDRQTGAPQRAHKTDPVSVCGRNRRRPSATDGWIHLGAGTGIRRGGECFLPVPATCSFLRDRPQRGHVVGSACTTRCRRCLRR